MAGGGEVDEAATGVEQGGDAVDEDEVAEVVGAELGLEAVGGGAGRGCPFRSRKCGFGSSSAWADLRSDKKSFYVSSPMVDVMT